MTMRAAFAIAFPALAALAALAASPAAAASLSTTFTPIGSTWGDVLGVVIPAFFGWVALAALMRHAMARWPSIMRGLPVEQHDLAAENFVSACHGIVGTVLACRTVAPMRVTDMSSPGWASFETPLVRARCHLMMQVTIGYMACDTVLMYWQQARATKKLKQSATEFNLMLLHHFLVGFGFTCGLVFPGFAYLPAVLELAEVTVPFYHLRWFLSQTGFDGTALLTAVDTVFFLLFIVVRGVCYIWLGAFPVRFLITQPAYPWMRYIAIIPVVFIGLNLYWCGLAVRRAVSTFCPSEKQKLAQEERAMAKKKKRAQAAMRASEMTDPKAE